jgi:integrase
MSTEPSRLKSSKVWVHHEHMRIYPREDAGGVWYVEFDRGRRRSLRTKDAKEAERRFAVLQREMALGKLLVMDKGTNKTLGEFRDEFVAWAEKGGQTESTGRANRLALDQLIKVAGRAVTLDHLGRKHIDLLVAECRARKCSQRSIDTYQRHCKAALKVAVDWEYVKANPFAAIKIKKRKPEIRPHLPPGAFSKFLMSIENIVWRRILALYCSTGRRRRELLGLQVKHVDMERKRYQIVASKTDESKRWYPMTTAAVAAFEAFGPLTDPESHLLPRVHPDTISDKAKFYLTAAGFPNVSLQGLRVSFGVEYLNKGGNLYALKELLGHADYTTTERYYSDLTLGYMEEEAARVSFGDVDLKGNIRRVK